MSPQPTFPGCPWHNQAGKCGEPSRVERFAGFHRDLGVEGTCWRLQYGLIRFNHCLEENRPANHRRLGSGVAHGLIPRGFDARDETCATAISPARLGQNNSNNSTCSRHFFTKEPCLGKAAPKALIMPASFIFQDVHSPSIILPFPFTKALLLT